MGLGDTMTRAKKITLTFLFALVFEGALVTFLFYVFYCNNPFLASQMVEYYSNNSNYKWYDASVLECPGTEPGLITLHDIHNEDGTEYGLDSLALKIFSPNIEQTWTRFNPVPDLKFHYRAAIHYFYYGYTCPIVQIIVSGEEILAFEDGKAALLEYAKTAH